MIPKKTLALCLLLTALALPVRALEAYDGIAAVVDGEIILRSELMDALYEMKRMPGFDGLPDKALRKKVLDRLVDDKVMLARARIDSIAVSDKELDQKVEEHLQRVARKQNLDQAGLAKAVQAQMGITIAEFRDRLRRQMREQTTLQQVQQRHIGEMALTPKDVEKFYAEYQDSIPPMRNCVRLRHLQVKVLPRKSELEKARTAAAQVLDALDRGGDFEQLARQWSGDSATRSAGGDMGFFRKGALDPRFEKAAYNLDQGRYTPVPIMTTKGFHLIKLLEKRDGEIRPAQILFAVEPDANDTASFKRQADTLRLQGLAKPDTFPVLVKQFSSDEATVAQGGDLGWFVRSDLDPKYASVVRDLDVGQISEPLSIDGAWHLFRLEDARDMRPLTLAEDWAQIEMVARSVKGQRRMQEFLVKWRKDVHIEIRDPELR